MNEIKVSAAMRRFSARIGSLAIVAIIAMLASCGVRRSVLNGSTQHALPVLSPDRPVEGVIATQEPRRYSLTLTIGQFVRIAGEGNVSLHLIGPRGDTLQRVLQGVLSHVVQETGSHLLEIARIAGFSAAQRYEIRVDELLSPAQHAARRDSLQRDPRVEWLTRHAIPLRSVSSDDDGFADLQPLREAIGDAQVVLLGEESHWNGGVISAKSRLVRFLHREMGFDVIAFESGLYDMWKVWQLIGAGHDPADVMPQGLYGIWSRAADFQPLARYIGQQAAAPHPLEVAGFDAPFRRILSRQQLLPELRDLVAREGLAVEGQDLVHGFWTTVFGSTAGIRGDSVTAPHDQPTRHDQEDVLSGIRWLAEQVGELAEARGGEERPELLMWAQVCRSLAALMAGIWTETAWSDVRRGMPEYDWRDRLMARNLTWLAREYFPGRRIIVWAANPHILRYLHRLENPFENPFRGPEPQPHFPFSGMGQGVWEVFGARSFVIAPTAYGGQWGGPDAPWTVPSDQDKSFELEELLAATGLDYAVLPLRSVSSGGDWLRAPILSRLTWLYRTILATWPDHADAILFLRASTPTMRRPERQ